MEKNVGKYCCDRNFDEFLAILLESKLEILSPPGRINYLFLLLAHGKWQYTWYEKC